MVGSETRGREGQTRGRCPRIQHPVVVVATPESKLLVVVVDPRADGDRFAEIHRCAVHAAHFAGGNEAGIHRREVIRVDQHLVTQDVAAARTGEFEIGVVGQIDMGGRVGRRPIVDPKLAFVGQGVINGHIEPPRVSLLTVRTDTGQSKLRAFGARSRPCRPQGFVEARDPAVQVVAVVVPGEDVGLIIEGEGPVGDAIPVSSDDGPEIGVPRQVIIEIVESEDDIGKNFVSIEGGQ